MLLLEYVLTQRLMRIVNCEDAGVLGSWKSETVLQKHKLTGSAFLSLFESLYQRWAFGYPPEDM